MARDAKPMPGRMSAIRDGDRPVTGYDSHGPAPPPSFAAETARPANRP